MFLKKFSGTSQSAPEVETLHEQLVALSRYGDVMLTTNSWQNNKWYCRVQTASDGGVVVTVCSDAYDDPGEAVSECLKKCRGIRVDIRALT